jgi:hypothetical protein
MKRFFLVTVILALFGFVANAQPQGLLGTWKCTTMEAMADGEVIMSMNCAAAGMDMKFTFRPNGAAYGEVEMEGERDSQKLTYKVSGTKILVTDEEGETVPFTYSNGKLYMMMEEDGMQVRVNFKKLQ